MVEHLVVEQLVLYDHEISDQTEKEIMVPPATRYTIISDYEIPAGQERHLRYRLIVEEHGQVNWFFGVTGGKRTVIEIDIILKGRHSCVVLKGLCLLKDQQQVELVTRQHHSAAHTTSVVCVKTILADASRSRYQGTIFIDRCAMHAHAQQYNKNLITGSQARAHSTPILEVLTDQVQCKHGSAVGTFDDEHLFYLQMRGLSTTVAQQLLIKAFCAEVIDHIPRSAVPKRWKQLLL